VAKVLTLQAAARAGIGSKNELVLIAEQEAAALYCLADTFQDLLTVCMAPIPIMTCICIDTLVRKGILTTKQ